jgi:hypothetical protein
MPITLVHTISMLLMLAIIQQVGLGLQKLHVFTANLKHRQRWDLTLLNCAQNKAYRFNLRDAAQSIMNANPEYKAVVMSSLEEISTHVSIDESLCTHPQLGIKATSTKDFLHEGHLYWRPDFVEAPS